MENDLRVEIKNTFGFHGAPEMLVRIFNNECDNMTDEIFGMMEDQFVKTLLTKSREDGFMEIEHEDICYLLEWIRTANETKKEFDVVNKRCRILFGIEER